MAGPQAAGPLTKGIFCLDWHNVLQFYREEHIRPEPKEALKNLLRKRYEVWVISAVDSHKRFRSTNHKMERGLAPIKAAFPLVKGSFCCWAKTGPEGKTAKAPEKGCHYMVDDNVATCKEAEHQGMEVFPIMTNHVRHEWRGAGTRFTSLAAAVDWFLDADDL